MATYKPRTTAPSATNKYFIHYSKGGYNTCIIIDKKTGSVLPNCVGYAQGRLLEITGCNKVNWSLPACNAEDWIDTAKKNGMQTGTTPKLGSVIVWKAGKTHTSSDGAGHVAVVEEIKSNGDLVVSASAYGGKRFYTSTIKKASGYNYTSSKQFIGFVYCGIEFTTKTVDEVAKEVIDGKWGVGADRKAKLTAAGYDYDAVQKKVNELMKSSTTTSTKKSNEEIAREVIQGKWGAGENRKTLLNNAGYDYNTIQALVNKMMK